MLRKITRGCEAADKGRPEWKDEGTERREGRGRRGGKGGKGEEGH